MSDFAKLQAQYDASPYPHVSLAESPKLDAFKLFVHNLTTAFYGRDRRVVNPAGKLILDAGCGSGYTSLVLAEANPGATIVGIDLSAASVEIAQARLAHHGFTNTQFHALSLLDVERLGLVFDYINCDEVLYLLPDPLAGLQALARVLKPTGMIRTNLHSYYQRLTMLRAQELCRMMQLMEGNPGELEVSIIEEIMAALHDHVLLKSQTWLHNRMSGQLESILMNYLLQGDKAYTVPQLFEMLAGADLTFVRMVRWQQWSLQQLLRDPQNPPPFLAMALPDLRPEEQLRMVELLHPNQRLLDFWCSKQPPVATAELPWPEVRVHLHPQLATPGLRQALCDAVGKLAPLSLNQFFNPQEVVPCQVHSLMALCLLPLWEGPQLFGQLVNRWLQARPVDPWTTQPIPWEQAVREVRQFLLSLEAWLYVLLEPSGPV